MQRDAGLFADIGKDLHSVMTVDTWHLRIIFGRTAAFSECTDMHENCIDAKILQPLQIAADGFCTCLRILLCEQRFHAEIRDPCSNERMFCIGFRFRLRFRSRLRFRFRLRFWFRFRIGITGRIWIGNVRCSYY